MNFLPWWVLLVCLAASAFSTYLLLGRTQAGDSPWAHFPLTAVLAPVVLVGAVVAAIVLSTFLSLRLEEPIGALRNVSKPPTQSEDTDLVASPEGTEAETTLERTSSTTTTLLASPDASPAASPSASAGASSSASPYP